MRKRKSERPPMPRQNLRRKPGESEASHLDPSGPTIHSKLMQKAGALLARRSYSCGELQDRLLKLGDEEEVSRILDRLEELDLLNDAEYAYNFAVRRIKQEGWGPVKVHHFLLRRRIPPHLAESAIERVRKEVSNGTALDGYLEKHWRKNKMPENQRGLRKLIAHLRQRGFQEDTIYNALRQKIPGMIWQRIDTGE